MSSQCVRGRSKSFTYRLVEHAGSSIFILTLRTIDEAVAQHMVVYAAISSLQIRCGACEALHAVHCGGTFCNVERKKAWVVTVS